MRLDNLMRSRWFVRVFRERRINVPRVVAIGLPLLGIGGSETLLFFGFIQPALWGHLLTLLAVTLAPLRYDGELQTFMAFAFVPLFRLVTLGMPVFFQLTVFWFPFIYGPLIPSLYLLARKKKLLTIMPRKEVTGALLVPIGVVLALILAEIEYRILRPEALIPVWSVDQVAMITVVMVGFVGLVEELLFRGILQRTLQARLGRWSGLLLASAVFGLMHAGYGLPAELVFGGITGFVFGLIYDWTDSITLIAVIHGVLNVFLFAVIPMQGSIVGIALGRLGVPFHP